MMIMEGRLLLSSLCILSSLTICWTYYFPIDLGECQDEPVVCDCGGHGRQVTVAIKRCSVFHRWEATCVPCTAFDKVTLCDTYRSCSECSGVLGEACKACPEGLYGKTCESKCLCENGGKCDQYSGKCSCPLGYKGSTCEEKTGRECTHPSAPFNGLVEVEKLSPGSLAKFKCKDNFVLVGTDVRTCMMNGRWSSNVPSCEYSCPVPEIGLHLRIGLEPVLIQPPEAVKAIEVIRDVVFSCDDGYDIIGDDSLKCLPTGKWSAAVPVCEKTCGVAPNIANAQIFGSGKFEGDSVNYKCDEGFEMKGESLLNCKNGVWLPSIPKCEKLIECEYPQKIPNGGFTSESEHFNLSTVVTYYCNDRFTLRGSSIRVCLPSGKWSGEHPWCDRTGISNVCPRPPIPEHGEIVHLQYIPAFTAGLKVRYTCKEGYIISGRRDRECLSNETWSYRLPKCVKVITCDDPGTPKNAVRTITIPVVRYARPGSRLPSSVSSETSSEKSDSEAIDNTGLKLPKGKYRVSTKIKFGCESQYYSLTGSRQRTCRASGQWSGRQPACVPECGISVEPRRPLIINGTATSIGQWPWQVGISKMIAGTWDIYCGGSLLNENWVVTAAHCITPVRSVHPVDKSTLRLYLGKHHRKDSKDDRSVEVREVSEIFVHEDFTPRLLDSDIALLRLKKPVKLTERILPICLPDQSDSEVHLRPGSKGIVTGWGLKEDGKNSDELKMVAVQTITTDDCLFKYGSVGHSPIITDNMFCAGDDNGHADACTGDSGGPLAFSSGSGEDKRWYLEGIVSWGGSKNSDCGKEQQYGVYTKLTRFVDWIHTKI